MTRWSKHRGEDLEHLSELVDGEADPAAAARLCAAWQDEAALRANPRKPCSAITLTGGSPPANSALAPAPSTGRSSTAIAWPTSPITHLTGLPRP